MPDNMPYIVSAFVLTWVVLLGYVLHLRKLRLTAERRLHLAFQDVSGGIT
ncbi:MAG: hypothetical protein Q8K82_18900 [Gemmatimonadaceae bacterium]|nr:hypothetical protein [Gemmatimonadaceae bacterium]